jgi:chromosome partitioning protein
MEAQQSGDAMKRVVFNQKGGVGKTSITCNLAAAFAKAGRKTLVVDLDAQANATQYLLGVNPAVSRTIADFFVSTLSFKLGKDTLEEALYASPVPNLWVVPAERSLSELQPKLEGRYKIFKLREAVDALMRDKGFDHVFFDTPPALNFYSMSALMAADRALIPFDCDAFSADALLAVNDTIEEVAADHNPALAAEGVIINQFQAQAKLPQNAIDKIVQQGFRVLTPYLSTSIVMRESHSEHQPLVFFRPRHKLAEEYAELAKNLMAGEKAIPKSAITGARSPKTARESPVES